MEHQSGCLLCGSALTYFEFARPLTCYYCGNTNDANATCLHGHYVCDQCHGSSANDLIERHCVQTAETNPVSIALQLMAGPTIKMHGPEHHFLVPAVLLAAYSNQAPHLIGDRGSQIAQARKRAEAVPGGWCGFCGACGAAIGTGIFMSLVTKATPLSTQAWHLCNRMTADSLSAIAEHGGPRCCKRNTFWALLMTEDFMGKQFGTAACIERPVKCLFSEENKTCLHQACQFYHPQVPQ